MKRTREPIPTRLQVKQRKMKIFLQRQALFKTKTLEDQINEWLENKNIDILYMNFSAAENVMYGFIYYREL